MKKWFVWWIERPREVNGGQWYGPHYLTDHEAFQEQLEIRTGASGISEIYRWFWVPPMPTWEFDARPNAELISSDVRFSWL